MHAFFQFAAILAACGIAQGQTLDLFTFDEVRAALERGGSVVLDVDGSECESNFPYPDGEHRYISLPFRNWIYVDDGAGNLAIGANDYYVQPSDPETYAMGITAREAILRSSGKIDFHFKSTIPATGESFAVDLVCELGRSGRIFEFQKNVAIDTYRTYREVKSALFLGKHVDAIFFAEACEQTEGWLPPGGGMHYGHRIEDFGVFNEATPDEVLVFHVSYLSSNKEEGATAPYLWDSLAYVVTPDNTVTVYAAVFQPPDFANNLWTEPASICEVGISMQFSSFREQDATYVTYSEVKDATLKGHEMEVIVFTEFCDVVEGPAPPASVTGIRFDQFQLFEAGGLWGDEHITYGNFLISPDGTSSANEVRLYPNSSLTFDWVRWGADGTSVRGQLACPLVTSALFHSISSERGPSFSYAQIMRQIKNEGAIFEIEVNYNGCTRGGSPIDLDSIYGAVLWETYIRENAQGIDTEFIAPVFIAEVDNVSGAGILWSTGIIIVYPTNEVVIYPRVYDTQGNDVTPFPSPDPIECKLNTGGLDGSVYFFRYP